MAVSPIALKNVVIDIDSIKVKRKFDFAFLFLIELILLMSLFCINNLTSIMLLTHMLF